MDHLLSMRHPRGGLNLNGNECVDGGAWITHKRAPQFCTVVALAGLIAFPMLTSAQDTLPRHGSVDDQYSINVNVDMVVLNATVLGANNAPVSGLDKGNFRIYEDGVLQQVTHFSHVDIPVTVGLVIDSSGSMGPKRNNVISAALMFARFSNPQDQIFVVNFNEKIFFGLPDDTPFTDRQAELQAALSTITTSGQTALYDAIAAALAHLQLGTRDKKVLIVISDGGDNASKRKLSEVLASVRKTDVMIYTIGVFDGTDEDRNPQVLSRLASDTGGEVFFPDSSKALAMTCERIAHDIRNQYTLAYIPTNRKKDGTYRTIQVKAIRSGRGRLYVRTRAGYFATLPRPSQAAGDRP